MMEIDLGKTLDDLGEGVQTIANEAHKATKNFHENFVSKVTPELGKFGDAAKFAVEILPGVSEYNALVEGDWLAFSIAAGMDVGALVVGAFTAGTGYVAVKGGTAVVKEVAEVAVKEVAEVAVKEVAEVAVKEVAEVAVKEVAEVAVKEVTEVAVKEVAEVAVKEVAEVAVKESAERLAQETTEKISKEVSEGILDETVEKAVKESAEKTGKEMVEISSREGVAITKGFDVIPIRSSQKERVDKTPVNNGVWTGVRGESTFIPDDPVLKKSLAKFGQEGVRYKNGIPDFSPFAKGQVEITEMSTNRLKNFNKGDAKFADVYLSKGENLTAKEVKEFRTSKNYTWHELNDGKTMQLIPTEINSRFSHLGGVGELNE